MKRQIREQVMEEMCHMKRPKTEHNVFGTQELPTKREHPASRVEFPQKKRMRPALPNTMVVPKVPQEDIPVVPQAEIAVAPQKEISVAPQEEIPVAPAEHEVNPGAEVAERTNVAEMKHTAAAHDDDEDCCEESGEEVDDTKHPTRKLRNIPSDQVMVMVMRTAEFEQVSAGNEIIRGFALSRVPIKLRIIAQENGKFQLLGSLTIEKCVKL